MTLKSLWRLMAWAVLGTAAGCGGGGGSSSPPPSLGTLSGTYDVSLSTELLVQTRVTTTTPSLPTGLNCSLAGGTTPPGMTLNADCSLSGTASEAGRFVSTLSVTAAGYSGSATVRLGVTVDGPTLYVTSPDNPRMLSAIDGNGKAAMQYQGLFSARTGDKITYSLAAGRLPKGVEIDPVTGSFTGTPYEMGKFEATIGVTVERNGSRATVTSVLQPFYVLEPALNFSYYLGFVNPIDLGPIQPVSPRLLSDSLGVLKTVKFEFIGTPPPGFAIDGTTGVISGAAEYPGQNQLAVRVLLAAPDGAQYAVETVPIDVTVRGILPVYSPLDCPGNVCYVQYRSESIYSTIATFTLTPRAMYQGQAGDVYTYEVLPPTDAARKLPSWVSVDRNTGTVTLLPTTSGDFGPYGMTLKVTTTRNGKTMSSLQRWDFFVNF